MKDKLTIKEIRIINLAERMTDREKLDCAIHLLSSLVGEKASPDTSETGHWSMIESAMYELEDISENFYLEGE